MFSIKEVRKKSGLTQAELAALLNVTPVMISKWETGKRNPKRETILRIADVLQVDALEIMGIKEAVQLEKESLKTFEGRVELKFGEYTKLYIDSLTEGEFNSELDTEGQLRFVSNAAIRDLLNAENTINLISDAIKNFEYQRTPDQEEE
ncbi:helix-turn-helix domain-containing protein [Eubacterium aggregans]|uniref:helix-turn-helix domain-containing protein n=1 Tax=Eubacterium aggregans TaxID=81409 RepID=UPI003F321F09